MAIVTTRRASILFALLVMFALVHAGEIAIYWGQNGTEGTLADTCKYGSYNIVILAFLNVFGSCRTPNLDLSGHCSLCDGSCKELSNDVKKCQNKKPEGIKVFLSLGGAHGIYNLKSHDDAVKVADYLWKNFLGGGSSTDPRPLGDVDLDGIDFDIEDNGGNEHWEVLASELKKKKPSVLLSAAPSCSYENNHLKKALKKGRFDYVWPQFYENAECQYSSGPPENIEPLMKSWNEWSTKTPAKKLFLGLPASKEASKDGAGFIRREVLKEHVLKEIKQSAKYGGIMLWSKSYDKDYSSYVKGDV